jgi:glycosidase
MPIMPSPSYHKYDVTDYRAIDPAYGTLEDFDALIAACEKRGIKVIIDLVMNHTSSDHPWFRAAREEARSGGPRRYLDYYNISETKIHSTMYYALGTTGLYYEGDFWSEMPDLNFDNPAVREEFKQIATFWLDRGVAGFRLDAIKHVYVNPGQSVETLAWFTEYCTALKSDVYIVGEVWSDDAEIMRFYTSGVPSLFNFSFADQGGVIAKSVNGANGQDFARNVIRWNALMARANPTAIDAPFIANHDTDRAAGYFGSDPVKEKLAAALYLFMPGNPFIYYGEEIGMEGEGIDENKRGPMIWSLAGDTGQTRGPTAMSRRWDAPAGVAEQLADPSSLLRFYIEAIRLKNAFPVIFYGKPALLDTGERAVAAFTLAGAARQVAVVHNLSGQAKTVVMEGAKRIGGWLAAGTDGARPSLKNGVLALPPFTTVVTVY